MKSGASTSLPAVSPSFSSNSSENLADIAARVIHELNLSHCDPYDDDYYSSSLHQNDAVEANNVDHDDDVESEFEFAVLRGGEEYSTPVSADELFYNGQIKPVYPLFNTDLVFGSQNDGVLSTDVKTTTLRKMMKDESERGNDSVSNSSSDEGDDLEGVPAGTYCVWTPQKEKSMEDEGMKRKSNSTGSSKRWRLRDLLYRSNSDGKDSFVFLTPSSHKHEKIITAVNKRKGVKGKDKKKSYLPYRPDLIGFFR